MIRLARLFRKGTALSRARQAAIAMAFLSLTVTTLAAAFTHATYEGVEAITSARAPRFVEVYTDEAPALLWAPVADAVGLKYTDVISITPLIENAPLPPGVSNWPQPGEAIVSPELYSELHAERTPDRYGEVTGIIEVSGLAHPTERLAYVRPENPIVENGHVVSGYGIDGPAIPVGDPLRASPFSAFITLILITCAVPAVILLLVSSRIDSKERTLRTVRLRVLGMSRGQELLLMAAEMLRPALAGSLTGIAIGIPFHIWNISLPGARFTLRADYLRDQVGMTALLTASVVCCGLVVVVIASSYFRREIKSTRPESAVDRRRASVAILCVSMLFATPWAYHVIAPGRTGNENLAVATVTIGSILCLLSLPHTVKYVYVSIMEGIRRSDSVFRVPSLFVASAHSVRWPGAPARLAATFAIMLGIVGLAHIWHSALTKDEVASRQLYAQVEGSIVTVTTYGATSSEELAIFDRALPPEVNPYHVVVNASGDLTLYSTLRGLAVLGLEPGEEAAQRELPSAWQRYLEFTEGAEYIIQSDVFNRSAELDNTFVLFSAEPSGIDIANIREQLNRYSAPVWPVLSAGHSWRGGVWLQAEQSRWLSVFAGWGLVMAAVAVWFGSTRYLRESREPIARLALVGGSTRVAAGVAFWLLFPAVGIGLLSGWAVSRILGAPFLSPGLGGTFPGVPLIIYTSIVAAFTGLIIIRLATAGGKQRR